MRHTLPMALQEGFWSTLWRGCGNATESVREHVCGITRSIVFECPCVGRAVPDRPADLKFRLGGPSDLQALSADLHEYGAAEKRFGFHRIEQGDSLIIGESGGDVVFYAWLMYGKMDVDMGVIVPLDEKVAYSYKVFTVAHARGLRICSAYYSHIQAWLCTQGYDRLICRIAAGNTPSVHAHARAGFQQVGRLWKVVLAGCPVYWVDFPVRQALPSLCSAGYFSSWGVLLRHEK